MSVASTPALGPNPIDPRQQRTRSTVFEATRVVLRREGFTATTFDTIALEAGVARSTLYRNWTDRDALIAEAIDDIADDVAFHSNEPVTEQLESVVVQMARALSASPWGLLLPAIVAAIESSPELALRYRTFTDSRRSVVGAIARLGTANGELPADLPINDFIDALVGPLFYRRLVRQERTSATWARRHAQRVIASFVH